MPASHHPYYNGETPRIADKDFRRHRSAAVPSRSTPPARRAWESSLRCPPIEPLRLGTAALRIGCGSAALGSSVSIRG